MATARSTQRFYRWISTTGSFPANTFVVTNADVVVGA